MADMRRQTRHVTQNIRQNLNTEPPVTPLLLVLMIAITRESREEETEVHRKHLCYFARSTASNINIFHFIISTKESTDLCKSRPDVDPLPGPELLEVHVPPDVMLGPCGGREGRVIALANAREPGVTAHTFLKMFRNYPKLEQMS